MNFNKVLLGGNLTRDPQLKYLPNQTPLVEFGIASNRRYTVNGETREDTTFVDCSAFGKQAEVINEHFHKGKAVFLEGRLKFDSWDDKTSGQKRSKLSIIVDRFEFVGGKSETVDSQPTRARQPAAAGAGPANDDGPDDGDVPW